MAENFAQFSTSEITIRKVSAHELPQLVELSRYTFDHTYQAYNDPADMQFYLDTYLNAISLTKEWQNIDNDFFIAWNNHQPVGYCKLARNTQPDGLAIQLGLEIGRLYVIQTFKKTGIGQQFIQLAKNVARQYGLKYLWLIVWQQNTAAIQFYQKQGFVIVGTQQFKLGKDIQSDWIMQLAI
ncbi:MAG: GNAT family N-acetyltransferase [Bacteroidota bacterium]|nr:GNAT family N-acetyltransferase [Bacteroidota bacterium]